MKKTVSRVITVCDICGETGSIRTCDICGKEVCGDHWFNIHGNARVKGRNAWIGGGVATLACHYCLRNNSIAIMNVLRRKVTERQEKSTV